MSQIWGEGSASSREAGQGSAKMFPTSAQIDGVSQDQLVTRRKPLLLQH
jgi:hypothetical protein